MSNPARPELNVMISGGFSLAYRAVLPAFERTTGIAVATASAASQGKGPHTMKAQLERGARADVVILSREGLSELTAMGRIADGSDVSLARVPLGAAVGLGKPKPNLDTVDAFKRTLLDAGVIAMPASTSGIFLLNDVLPRLGIADKVAVKVGARGTDATAMVAAGEADIVLGPVSELVNVAGIAFVGRLPAQVQLLQEVNDALSAFYAATVELQVQNSVTAFTASDFGRTFLSNGDGSDHGWGSHHLIVGGAVQGGRLFGRVPTLAINGPDDTGDGRWIPTTSVDEYSATLAKWFGVSPTDMPTVFPNLYRFNNPDLGFMGA
jgi:molybdate transport system substrate-binding protein